eukprot:GHVL01017842.1.p1 GENE.GHVL01017842.1~~GHVL01017842.1.p1  ORF type:complete len:184 (+),score=27.21 GHVL01017842.1:56-607(+)
MVARSVQNDEFSSDIIRRRNSFQVVKNEQDALKSRKIYLSCDCFLIYSAFVTVLAVFQIELLRHVVELRGFESLLFMSCCISMCIVIGLITSVFALIKETAECNWSTLTLSASLNFFGIFACINLSWTPILAAKVISAFVLLWILTSFNTTNYVIIASKKIVARSKSFSVVGISEPVNCSKFS